MKKLFLILIIFTNTYLTAQVVTAVAPLKPGNKWVYQEYLAGDYAHSNTYQYLITDSIKVINGISFYAARVGRDLGYTTYYGVTSEQFYVKYDTIMYDSLYKYFKLNINKDDTWEQKWNNVFSPILYSTVTDTFSAQVFGKNTLIYVIDRSDSVIVSSREYCTKEYGMLNGLYEQEEDILKGCVIDGVLYGDTNTVVGIDEVDKLPSDFILYQNYPNPFNPSTVISWQSPIGSNVKLIIYDLLGRKIRTLVNQYYNPGSYSVTFNADNLTSGTYFYRLITNDFIKTKKMLLIL